MSVASLTGKQRRQLQEAILSAFNYSSLEQCVSFELNTRLDHIVSPGPLTAQVNQLIAWAELKTRLRELMTALRVENDTNTSLAAAERDIFGGGAGQLTATAKEALSAVGEVVESQLQADPKLQALIPGKLGLPYGVDGQDDRWWRAKAAVGRVESPDGNPWGTGLLVGPDLFLTNDHVRRDAKFDTHPKAVRVRFGYSRTDAVAGYGEVAELADVWLLASSPASDLDYCVVRLKTAAGTRPVGQDQGARARGWLVPSPDVVKVADIISVLGHPSGEALMQAAGVVTTAGADGWLDYSAHTLPGSSGSPVLNARFELVGLHSRAGTTVANRGAALAAILKHLTDTTPAVRDLIGTTPP